jgi:signal transduction histidine kinase
MGLSMVAWFIGDTVWLYLLSISVSTFISPADAFYLLAYVFLIVSLFSIPGSLPPSRRRNMVYVEISILVLSATIIFAILLLVPGKPNLSFDPFTLLMVFIYPVLDTILIWILMILIFTYPIKRIQKVLGIILAGAICIFVSDLLYLINSLYNPWLDDYLADIGYYIFYILLLLAALKGFKEIRMNTSESDKKIKTFNTGNWIIFIPGIFLIIIIGLLLVFVLNNSFVLFHGSIILLALIIILFIIHQYLVITDNIKLTKEMRLINSQLEIKVEQRTEELSKTNEELLEEMKVKEIAEEHLARSNQELAQINMDKDKLFTILAHDLRSPLGSMMNLSELLVENIKDFDENEIVEVADTLHKSATQTFQLLNDLLAWSSVQMGKGEREKEYFPISDIIVENFTLLNSDASRKQIEIKLDIDPELYVFADKFAIQTVLRNLMSNAIKFTRHQGIITIKSEKDSAFIKISVIDNGIGITKEKQKKIFRVGAVSSSPGTDGEKGTGFGLLLCKDLIERNGGEIKLISEKGKGSTFYFTLPVHETGNVLVTSPPDANAGRIELEYDHNRRLGLSKFKGEFNHDILQSELTRVWNSLEYNTEYSVLIDLRQASFSMDANNFHEISDIFNSIPGQHANRKFALLTTTPQQVVYSTMFGQLVRSKFKFAVEVFSTYDGAINWLGN